MSKGDKIGNVLHDALAPLRGVVTAIPRIRMNRGAKQVREYTAEILKKKFGDPDSKVTWEPVEEDLGYHPPLYVKYTAEVVSGSTVHEFELVQDEYHGNPVNMNVYLVVEDADGRGYIHLGKPEELDESVTQTIAELKLGEKRRRIIQASWEQEGFPFLWLADDVVNGRVKYKLRMYTGIGSIRDNWGTVIKQLDEYGFDLLKAENCIYLRETEQNRQLLRKLVKEKYPTGEITRYTTWKEQAGWWEEGDEPTLTFVNIEMDDPLK